MQHHLVGLQRVTDGGTNPNRRPILSTSSFTAIQHSHSPPPPLYTGLYVFSSSESPKETKTLPEGKPVGLLPEFKN